MAFSVQTEKSWWHIFKKYYVYEEGKKLLSGVR